MKHDLFLSHAVVSVGRWMNAFGHPVNFTLQYDLIREELAEFKEAIERPMTGPNAAELLKEASDVIFVLAGYIVMHDADPENAEDEAELESIWPHLEEFTTLINGIKAKIGPEVWAELLMASFDRVVASNMSKLDDEGNPIRNEDGKVVKGPNYAPPDLSDLGARLFTALKPKRTKAAA